MADPAFPEQGFHGIFHGVFHGTLSGVHRCFGKEVEKTDPLQCHQLWTHHHITTCALTECFAEEFDHGKTLLFFLSYIMFLYLSFLSNQSLYLVCQA